MKILFLSKLTCFSIAMKAFYKTVCLLLFKYLDIPWYANPITLSLMRLLYISFPSCSFEIFEVSKEFLLLKCYELFCYGINLCLILINKLYNVQREISNISRMLY